MHRVTTRIASAVALLASVTACSEQITSERARIANVAIVPELSVADQAIFRSLSTFALNVDNVHVMLFRPTTETTLSDTVVQFSVTSNQIAIQLSVHLDSAQENLSAFIELRGGPTVLFSGSETVTARVGQATGTGKPVTLSYVGPGSTASLLRIAPRAPTTFVGGTTRVVATATDVQGLPVSLYPFTWSSSNTAIARIDTLGTITGVGAGSASIIARGITGIADTVPVTITGAPAAIVAVSGDAQTATVGQALASPIVVQAQTAGGAGVPGLTIAFRVTSGSGTLQTASVVTDSKGNATNALTLNNVAGPVTIEASAGTLPALTLHATAAPGAPAQLQPVNPTVSAYLNGAADKPVAVQVADAFGNAVSLAGLGVSFTLSDTSSIFTTTQTRSATIPTDSKGVATAPPFALRFDGNIQIQALTTLPPSQRVTAIIGVTYLGVSVP